MSQKAQGEEVPQDKATVLVVDDDEVVRRQLASALGDRFHVIEAESRIEAVKHLQQESVDVVFCDLHLPPDREGISEGLAIIETARAGSPSVPVVVITENAKQSAIKAIRHGAYGVLEKPFDDEEVLHIVQQAVRIRHLEQEIAHLRSERATIISSDRGFNLLIGVSSRLKQVVEQARSVADTSANVLLTGESGTGKEVLARAIHEESSRRSEPFVAVSCAALSETLIESELFGHEKGAFTNAVAARKGRFEMADGGTLFLDEVGDLSASVQIKLLRVLQERSFERVGGSRTLTVNIRLIAATNRDLEHDIEHGGFRSDLFYRLNVVPLALPPLRERREDIPILASHFAVKAAEKHGRPLSTLSPSLIEALQDYDWPGNIRELENMIERLVVLTSGPSLGVDVLPDKMLRTLPEISANGADDSTLEGAMLSLKRRMIINAVQSEGGNKAAAAKRLGVSRSYLHRLINELHITSF